MLVRCAMKSKIIFLFLLLSLMLVPSGYALTEDAIREVGYSFVGVIIAGIFSLAMFFVAFNLDKQHSILQLLLFLVGFSGLINMSGMIADQGGKFFSIFQLNVRLLYAIIAYIIVALFIKAVQFFKSSTNMGGRKDE